MGKVWAAAVHSLSILMKHEWLRDGLGEAIAEDSPSISSYGSESFDEQMRRRPVPKAAAFSGTIRREKWLRPTGH